MKTSKEEVHDLIENLSEEVTLEEIQYHLYVMQKIKKGLYDIETGKTHTHEQVKEKLSKWAEK